jgi:ParB-like chromosome segregation protein Spo0J
VSLELGLHQVELAKLHESPHNPRQITPVRFAALKHALASDPEMMKARPLIAVPDGEVVCGNMRHRALVELAWVSAPTFVADLDQKRKREWLLRDNNEYGDWVPSEVAALIRTHDAEGGDLALTGFADPEIEAILQTERAGPEKPITDEGAVDSEAWDVIVACESESRQVSLIELLVSHGYEVRALIGQ